MAGNTPECLANLVNATLCTQDGNGECFVRNSTFSTCRCAPGRVGSSCDELRMPITLVYIIDAVIYIAVLAFFVGMTVRHFRRHKGQDFIIAREKGVLTSLPKYIGLRALFVYRLVAFGFVFGVHIFTLVLGAPDGYRFYTVWNFIVLTVYFGIGLGLTGFSLWKGVEAIALSPYMTFNATLHYLLLEIELPNTLIVDVITWGILLPSCDVSPCPLLSFTSFTQHLVNFFLIAGDFALCRHAFDRRHYHFNLAMPTFYAIFHIFYTLATDKNGHNPAYFFMDASSMIQPAWIIAVLFIHVSIFFLVWAFTTFVLGRKLDNVYEEPQSSALVANDTKVADDTKVAENA